MKQWISALAMCQSMFCAIPCPWNLWDEKARDKMLLCLPLIGLEIGCLWFALAAVCRMLNLNPLLGSLVLCAWPWISTGFLHLDGFMDVTDAVKSWRSLERRREILKDSHVGSFAVIGIGLLILAQFAVCASLEPQEDLRVLILIPVVSRCCSVMAVIGLPPMATSQYASKTSGKRDLWMPALILILSLAAGFVCFRLQSLALIGCAAGYALALRRGYRSLEGMNGDISGYSQTISELAALAVLAVF